MVFARDRTRDAAWLRAEARRNPPTTETATSAEGQPEDDIYHGTGADRRAAAGDNEMAGAAAGAEGRAGQAGGTRSVRRGMSIAEPEA